MIRLHEEGFVGDPRAHSQVNNGNRRLKPAEGLESVAKPCSSGPSDHYSVCFVASQAICAARRLEQPRRLTTSAPPPAASIRNLPYGVFILLN